jgi:hypothetical protein
MSFVTSKVSEGSWKCDVVRDGVIVFTATGPNPQEAFVAAQQWGLSN